jgi:hypothetical protein
MLFRVIRAFVTALAMALGQRRLLKCSLFRKKTLLTIIFSYELISRKQEEG